MRRAAFDEMNGLDGHGPADIRSAYDRLKRWLDETPAEVFDARRSQAELFFRRIGITFAVYGDNESTERLIPFDIIPRVLTKPEWTGLERGSSSGSRPSTPSWPTSTARRNASRPESSRRTSSTATRITASR